MEIQLIIVLIVCIVVLAGLWYLAKDMDKIAKNRTYVYPKNKHRYYIVERAKLKNPTTGEWHDALIYRGLDDGGVYVRDFHDFAERFVPIKEWNNGTV